MILAQTAACQDASSSPPPSGKVRASPSEKVAGGERSRSTGTPSGTTSHRGKASTTFKRPTSGSSMDNRSTKASSSRDTECSRFGVGASSGAESFHPEPKKRKAGNKKTEGSHQSSGGAPSSDASVGALGDDDDDDEDEAHRQAKQEFLRAMRIMEEAGLVTEKGIGAGMVK